MSEAEALALAVEALIERVVERKLAARPMAPGALTPRSPWMTPPAAARETGIPEKRVRELVRAGALGEGGARLRNQGANPRQPKYLVNVDTLRTVVERGGPAPAPAEAVAPVDLSEAAARLRTPRARR